MTGPGARRPGADHAATRAAARAAVSIPALAMLVVGFWGLRRGSLWRDEGITRYLTTVSFGTFVRTMGHVDIVHCLYYLLIRVVSVLGHGEVVLRAPSVLAMAGAVACTAALGTRLSRRPALGALAGLVMVVSPFVTHYAQEARSYALVCCAVAGAGLLLVRAVESGRRSTWLAYGVVLWVAITLNELAALVIVAHAVTVLIARTPLRSWIVSVGAALVAAAPLVLFSLRQARQLPARHALDRHDVVTLVKDFAGPSPYVLVITGVLVVVGLVLGLPGDPGRAVVGVWAMAVPLALVPPVVLLAMSAVTPRLWDPRYIFYAVPGVALLVALGAAALLERIPAPPVVAGALAALLVLALFLAQLPLQRRLRTVEGRPENMAAIAADVNSHDCTGDGVVFTTRNYRTVRLAYPGDFRLTTDVMLRISPQASGTVRGIDQPVARIPALVDARPRVWQITNARADHSPADAAATDTLRQDFRIAHSWHAHGLTARLWVRRSAASSGLARRPACGTG